MRSSEIRHKLMKECKELASKHFPLEVALTKQMDKIYYEVLKRTGDIKPQTYAQKANYALASQSYRLLHCTLDTLEAGYYEVSMSLLRSVYERILQMNYFATYQDAARQWLEEDKKISQQEIRNKLGIRAELYEMLSIHYTHSLKAISIDPLVFEKADGKLSLNLYPVYSPAPCRLCLMSWIAFAQQTIQQMQRVFKAEQISDKSWIRKVVEVQNVTNQYLNEMKLQVKKEMEFTTNSATESEQ
ncbi:MAG: hypothetical protein ACREBU_07595 [Nitrososphaera sp.]